MRVMDSLFLRFPTGLTFFCLFLVNLQLCFISKQEINDDCNYPALLEVEFIYDTNGNEWDCLLTFYFFAHSML